MTAIVCIGRIKARMKRYKRGELAKKIFQAAGVGIAFGAVIVMPGLAIGLKSIIEMIKESDGKIDRWKITRSLKSMEKRKLVSLKERDGEIIVEFSEEGRIEVMKCKIDQLEIKIPQKWDGKWRLVIFDIPERKKLARDVLREKLEEMGFIALQKSVFVCPYPCQKEILLLKRIFEIDPYILLIEADYIDNQRKLIKKFNL